ncbi:unnamed protein product [Amaranthus hypochondriacus]
MVKIKQQKHEIHKNYNYNDIKSDLAVETCNIFTNSHHSFCNHHLNSRSPTLTPFIDWYLILRVGEDAGISIIRKQYHKLALLLHPDKNKHPKAELAFKLISQAYKCLSDEGKRSNFNLERWRNQCTECSRIPHNTHSPHNANNNARNSRSYKIQQQFRALKEKLKEEAKVIQGCIRVNQGPTNKYPVFDPSSYSNLGYPHRRNPVQFYKKAASFWDVKKQNMYDQRRGRCEYPLFELTTDCSSFNIKATCVSS